MKKILLGICNIGNGHISRQRLFLDKLLEYDVRIVIAISGKYDFFPDNQKISFITVKRPWTVCDNNGINFKESLYKYQQDQIDYYLEQLNFFIEVEKVFGNSKPDLVITDYEPVCAQYAYAANIPLICLHQQSKYLFLEKELENDELRMNFDSSSAMLKYFFPYADKRYVPTLFPYENRAEYNIEFIPPLVRQLVRKEKKDGNKIVVYFSDYPEIGNKYFNLLKVLDNIKGYEFFIYGIKQESREIFNKHIYYKEIGSGFDQDLQDCNGIISTAGFQLISEALFWNIPIMVFPLATFDQFYCAKIVENYGFGKWIKSFEVEEIHEFLNNLESYVEAEKQYKDSYFQNTWDEVLMTKLEKDFGIEKGAI